MKKTRLFLQQPKLFLSQQIAITASDLPIDFNYLANVMRSKVGDEIYIFNGLDGEFKAKIIAIAKKQLTLEITSKTNELKVASNITLAFALVKSQTLATIATKATELGIARFQPLITQHTISDKISFEKFIPNIKEACEQCERNDFAEILSTKKLEDYITENDFSQKIIVLCDESDKGLKASLTLFELLKNSSNKEIVVMVGPEGGFAESEFEKLRQLRNVTAISLGNTILRCDTAIIVAIGLVKEFIS